MRSQKPSMVSFQNYKKLSCYYKTSVCMYGDVLS